MAIYQIYIGTRTDDTESKGIYHLTFDSDGQSVSAHDVAFLRNPSYLGILGRTLYAGSERLEDASIVAYDLGDGIGPLNLIAEKELDGKQFCHLYSHRAAGTIFVCLILSGNLLILEPESLEVLSEMLMSNRGSAIPLTHCAVCSEDGKLLASADMGGDRVYVCSLTNGVIDHSMPTFIYDSVLGSGPRHLTFHPAMDMLYVANERNSTLNVFSVDRSDNSIKLEQAFPAGEANEGVVNYPSSIIITSDGRYVLIANRGLDTISVFAVSPDGLINKAGEYPCYGKWPRHMILTNDMRYLIISNQHSHEVVICPFDLTTGNIKPPICKEGIPEPNCAVEVWRG